MKQSLQRNRALKVEYHASPDHVFSPYVTTIYFTITLPSMPCSSNSVTENRRDAGRSRRGVAMVLLSSGPHREGVWGWVEA
jgi:hypothetical protein